jgi:hypothetical protein
MIDLLTPSFTVYQYVAFGCVTFIYLVFCHKLEKIAKAIE